MWDVTNVSSFLQNKELHHLHYSFLPKMSGISADLFNSKFYNGLTWWLSGIEFTCQFKRHGFFTGSGRSPGEGNGNSVQYSCLENSMNRGAWWASSSWGPKRVEHNSVIKLQSNKFYDRWRGSVTKNNWSLLYQTSNLQPWWCCPS